MIGFKKLYESSTDVDRYKALMDKTDGDWNVWDDKEKAEYIKKWSWDSTKMKLIKKKAGDEEISIPKQPEEKSDDKKTNKKEEPTDADSAEAVEDAGKGSDSETDEPDQEELDAAQAEEERKAEIKIRKEQINKTRSTIKDLEKIANQMNKNDDIPENEKTVDLDIKILAAIRRIQNKTNAE
jgi:hypothetical protein